MKPFNKNKKGTALITVVGVMFVLLILVSATMVLVMAAHKKAMTNYYTNQAYITARSIVETFIAEASDATQATDVNSSTSQIRRQLIGKYNPSSKKMEGGMSYDGYTGTTSETNKDTDPNNEYYYMDVKLTLPAEMENGFGKIVNPAYPKTDSKYYDTIRIHRISETRFKVTATVIIGEDDQEISKVVSEEIILSPTKNPSLFDSSLIAKAGVTMLMDKTQLYGGYINTGTTNPKFNGSKTRYIGNFYSFGEIKANDNCASVYMASNKMHIKGKESYVANYMQSPHGINITAGHLKAKSYMTAGEFPIDRTRPYIYASTPVDDPSTPENESGPAGNVVITNIGAGESEYSHEVGSDIQPVDIFSDGNVTLGNLRMYGDIYCKGKVTIEGPVYLTGTIYCNSPVEISRSYAWKAKLEGPYSEALLVNPIFPKPYKQNKYDSITEFENSTKYNEAGSTDIKIAECFSLGNNNIGRLDDITANPDGTEHVEAPTNIDSSKFPLACRKEFSISGSPSYTHKMYSGCITSNLTGKTLTISVGEHEDFFITYKGDESDNVNDLSSTKIIVSPKSGDYSKMGNVYFKMLPGKATFNNVELGVDAPDYKKINKERFYGTKADSSIAEPASHFFILLDGSNDVDINGDNILRAYMYCPDRIFKYNTGATFKKDIYYDNIKLVPGNLFDIQEATPTPTIIGTCISHEVQLGDSVASIFIPPEKNIFDEAVDMSLEDYQWSPAIMDRK